MKVKFLKTLESALGKYIKGGVHDLEHDEYTVQNWIETGYCKEVVKAKVKEDEAVPNPSE
jgi:predicted MPP superfamily phosphohydrolase